MELRRSERGRRGARRRCARSVRIGRGRLRRAAADGARPRPAAHLGRARSGWLELGPWERHAWRAAHRRVARGLRAGRSRASTAPGDARVLHAHACEATYGDPAYGGNRDERWLAAHRVPGAAVPAGAASRDGLRLRRRRHRVRSRRRHGGRSADCRGLVGRDAGEGPQPPDRHRRAVRASAATSPTTRSRRRVATCSAPTRCSSRGPAPATRVGEVNNLPSTVGGGGVHADAKLPRFREEDFALRSARGPIDGASVEDWPFGYDELEPHYAAVEKSFGVAGEETQPVRRAAARPVPDAARRRHAVRARVGRGGRAAGFASVPRADGRELASTTTAGRPCVDCGFCGGYGCPIHAKGDPISSLQRSLADRVGSTCAPTRTSRRSCSTAAGSRRPACATSTSRRTPTRRSSRCARRAP